MLVAARDLQSIKTFLTLELSQYCKSGSIFSSSEQVAACSDCRQLGNACVCASPSVVRPAQAVLERGPKSLAVDFAPKSSITSGTAFGENLRDCQTTSRAQTWTQT